MVKYKTAEFMALKCDSCSVWQAQNACNKIHALVPRELCLVPVRIRLYLLDVVSLLVEVDQFAAPLVNLLAHFRKLSLVSVERDEHLWFHYSSL